MDGFLKHLRNFKYKYKYKYKYIEFSITTCYLVSYV